MSKRTEKERVLRALLRGQVRQSDFAFPTCDGGKIITRVAARIYDLRKDGHNIPPSTKADDGTAVYRLNLACATGMSGGDESDASEPPPDGPTAPAGFPTPDSGRGRTAAVGGSHLDRPRVAATSARTASKAAAKPVSASPPRAGGQLLLDLDMAA